MLTEASLPALQRAIADLSLDGWLLYDFRGVNGIANGLLRLQGMVSRRIFAFIPREGPPVAITHAIEQLAWAQWPAAWPRVVYSAWPDLERQVATLVRDKRVAMEYSPGDAVPVVDRVPAGVIEMVRAAGATVVTSAELVTRAFALWTPEQIASHHRTAEVIAGLAREAFARVGRAVREGRPIAEHEVMAWLREQFERNGLLTDHGPNVSATENAANPHYEPSADQPRWLRDGDTLLIDLWAHEPNGMWADQTWMAVIGPPSARALSVWTTIRDARDAALTLLQQRLGQGGIVRGAEVDDAARAVVVARGLGEYFTHRTGHAIDARGLHGAGPNIDNLETREERALIAGVGFSIEPGVYIPGEIGMRTEVNAYVTDEGVVVTPAEIQRDLIVL